jgi:hypothetical protein
LLRKRPGRPDQVDSFTRATAVLDPLGLLLRVRFGPMSAPSSFEILDGHALWIISFSSIHTTSETPATVQLNGHVEPIYWDGTPDKERTGRDFSLFLSNDSARMPVRLIVPFGLGQARAEIVQLSRTEGPSRLGMTDPVTLPEGFGVLPGACFSGGNNAVCDSPTPSNVLTNAVTWNSHFVAR